MTKLFISIADWTDQMTSALDDVQPMQSKAAMPAYSCKVYRTFLEQGAASEHARLHPVSTRPQGRAAMRA